MKCFRNGKKMSLLDIREEYYSQFKVKCKCGHTLIINPKIGKQLCNHCGNYGYLDKKLEFIEKLKKEMKK